MPKEVELAPRVPPGPRVLAEVPWGFAKDAIGAEGTVLLEFLVRLAYRVAKDAMAAHPVEINGEKSRVPRRVAEDAIGEVPGVCESPS